MAAELLNLFRSIETADVSGKRVLIRADLNVPMSGGQVTDATRIERLLPTFQNLLSRGAKVVILSHLGRPDGKPVAKYSLKPVADKLSSLLGVDVFSGEDCVGPAAEAVVEKLEPGQIAMLENLRYHAEEEKNDAGFATALAKLGDLYVNDAFSVSHRAHASTEALARLLPAYAGPSMLAEIRALKLALDAPQRPVAAIVGGSKVSTKIAVLGHLAKKVDFLIIGGGMANTFLFAKGLSVGKSLHEPGAIATVEDIQRKAAEAGCKISIAGRCGRRQRTQGERGNCRCSGQ